MITQSDGYEQWQGVTLWNDTFLTVMYTELLRQEFEKMPIDLLNFTLNPEM